MKNFGISNVFKILQILHTLLFKQFCFQFLKSLFLNLCDIFNVVVSFFDFSGKSIFPVSDLQFRFKYFKFFDFVAHFFKFVF